MYDFGIFCHLLRLMGLHRVGDPSGYLKSVVFSFLSLFPFFPFNFLSFFLFFLSCFLSLSRGPFSSGAHGHCPPMPPSRYATDGQAE